MRPGSRCSRSSIGASARVKASRGWLRAFAMSGPTGTPRSSLRARYPTSIRPKVAISAFSSSGGHIFPVAARDPVLAAAITQTPLADAPRALPAAARYSTPLAQLRLMSRAVLDTLGGMLGRKPLLVPLTGERGTVAMLSTPDGLQGDEALNASRYPEWQQKVAARSVLRLGSYRPGLYAARVQCPLLVMVCDDDHTAPPGPAIRAAKRAPRES